MHVTSQLVAVKSVGIAVLIRKEVWYDPQCQDNFFQLFLQHFTVILQINLSYEYVGKLKNLKCFVQLQTSFFYAILRKAQEP